MAEVVGNDTRKRTESRYSNGVAAPATVTKKKAKVAEKVSPESRAGSFWHGVKSFNSLSQEEKASSLPFCIAEGVTLEQFRSQCNKRESGGCFRWEFKDGKAWIYELPHAAHDSAAHEVIRCLERSLGPHDDDLRGAASPRCDNNAAQWSYEPDGSLTKRGCNPGPGPDAADSAGNRWPNLIVEVAFQETEKHVKAKALEWLNTANSRPQFGVQQVIVIKIGVKPRTDGHRTMKAWQYERGAGNNNPLQYFEFGNHGPNNGATAAGLPGMQLRIPTESLYCPMDPPDDVADELGLDLFRIRDTIESVEF